MLQESSSLDAIFSSRYSRTNWILLVPRDYIVNNTERNRLATIKNNNKILEETIRL